MRENFESSEKLENSLQRDKTEAAHFEVVFDDRLLTQAVRTGGQQAHDEQSVADKAARLMQC